MKKAQSDIETAFDWYNEQVPKLGLKYLNTIEKRLDFIMSFPFASPMTLDYESVRYTLLIDYPFVIYYKIEPNLIVIIAVLHTSQNMEKLKLRQEAN